MDWGSLAWKQGLTPLAIQNVNNLEEKIQKLQKERDQKQVRLDWLAAELDKQQRNAEKKNQEFLADQRKLQSLENDCKNLENKQQKLLNEIQNRDARINSLEELLSKTKKDNCKLMAKEKDLKDLKSIEEFKDKTRRGQNFSFEESISESSVSNNHALSESDLKNSFISNKENNRNILNESHDDQKALNQTLKEKIALQESIINELQFQIKSISASNKKEHDNDVLSTPAKVRNQSVTDSSVLVKKESFNFFDSFGSTPAKGNKEKILNHRSECTTADSGNDKIIDLENRLKQLCQELDCQRHNFEASKNAIEQKFKENENVLKADLKFQTQMSVNLDKELKDLKSKYQQESGQFEKKLDVLTLQLKKSEEIKCKSEQDLINLEKKLHSYEQSLKKKEEEFLDFQKMKNASEMTFLNLKSEKAELEKKYLHIQKENVSLTNQIKLISSQLEKSNNHLIEKETNLVNCKKEIDTLSQLQRSLQNKIKDLEKEKISSQGECTTLKNKLQQLVTNETMVKDQLKETESSLASCKKEIHSLSQLQGSFQSKIKDLEKELISAQLESTSLKSQLKDLVTNETILKDHLKSAENEKAQLQNNLKKESNKVEKLELDIVSLGKCIQSLQEEIVSKDSELCEIVNQLKQSRNQYESDTKELQVKVANLISENTATQKELKESSVAQVSLKESLQHLEKEKNDVTILLKAEIDKSKRLDGIIEEKEKLNVLNKELLKKISDYENDIKELQLKVSNLMSENTTVQEELKERTLAQASLKENLQFLEKEKYDVTNFLNAEIDKSKRLEEILEEKEKVITLNSEELLKKTFDYENDIKELQLKVSNLMSENTISQKELKESTLTQASLKENLQFLEKEKYDVTSLLNAEIDKSKGLEAIIEEKEKVISLNREELLNKESNYENDIKELQLKVSNLMSENTTVQEELKERTLAQASLKENLQILEKEKYDVTCLLNSEIDKSKSLEFAMGEKEKVIALNREELLKKESDYENDIKELQLKVSNLMSENTIAQKELKESTLTQASLKENLQFLEKEKCDITSILNAEIDKSKGLEAIIEEKEKMIVQNKEELIKNQSSHENDIKELQLKVSKLMSANTAAQNELKESTLAQASLKETLQILGKDKKDITSHLNAEIDKSKRLEEILEEKEKVITLNREELLKKTSDYENNIKEIQVRISSLMSENTEAQKELKESNMAQASLKENFQLLEKDKNELTILLNAEIDKSKRLEEAFEEKEKINNFDRENFLKKTCDYEKNIEELQTKITSLISENSEVQKVLQENNLMQTTLKQNMQFLEKEKSDIMSNLEEVNAELKKLDEIVQEKEKTISSQREELHRKTSEFESNIRELQVKISSLISENTALQQEMEANTSTETALKENMELLEKEKFDISNHLTEEISKSKKLEEVIEEKEKAMSFQINELSKKTSEYETKIKDLEEETTSMHSECISLKSQLRELVCNETTLKDHLKFAENEKAQLLNSLKKEINKVERLELDIQSMGKCIQSLQEDIVKKDSKLCEIVSQIKLSRNQYESSIRDMQEKISNLMSENSSVTKELEENKVLQISLKENLQLLEKQKSDVAKHLDEGVDDAKRLEQSIEEKEKIIILLREELSKKTSDFENDIKELQDKICNLMSENSASIKDFKETLLIKTSLDERLQLLEKEKNDVTGLLTNEMAKSKELIEVIKENEKAISLEKEESFKKISELEVEKQTISDSLIERTENFRKATMRIAELESFISSHEEDLAHIQSKLMDISKESEDRIFELESKLHSSETKCKNLLDQLKQAMVNEETTMANLAELAKEKSELMNSLNKESSKVRTYESNMIELNEKIASLNNDIDLKSSALQKCKEELLEIINNQKESQAVIDALNKKSQDFEKSMLRITELEAFILSLDENLVEIENKLIILSAKSEEKVHGLEIKLHATEHQCETLKMNLNEAITKEEFVMSKLSSIEEENVKLRNNLCSEQENVMRSEASILELTQKILLLHEEISSKSVSLQKVNEIILENMDCQAKICELENKLCSNQQECESLKNQIEELLTNENIIMKKLSTSENEKSELKNCLDKAFEKIKMIEPNLLEANEKVAFLNNEISLQSSTNEKLNEQLAESTKHQSNMEELKIKISNLMSENSTVLKKLEENTLRETALKQNAQLLEKEKSDIVSHLTEVKENIKRLEGVIQEKEKTICLQREELINKTDFESIVKELETKISNLISENSTIQTQLEYSTVIQTELKQTVQCLEKEKCDITNHLDEVSDQFKKLEEVIQEKEELIDSLKEQLLEKTAEFESNVKELETKISNLISENSTIQTQLEDSTMIQTELKQTVQCLEKEKCDITNHLDEVSDQFKKLEEARQEKEKMHGALKEQLLEKTLEFEDKINELEGKLCYAQRQYEILKDELDQAVTNEKFATAKLSSVENEKVDKMKTCELSFMEMNETIAFLREEISLKTLELEECNKQLFKNIDCQARLQKVEELLTSLKTENVALSCQLKESAANEENFDKKIAGLENENRNLCETVNDQTKKIEDLELCVEEMNVKILLLEEELSLKSFETDATGSTIPSLEQHQKKIQKLEDGIILTKSENVLLRTQLKNVLSKQELSERKLNLIENEKRVISLLYNEADKSVAEMKEIIFALQLMIVGSEHNFSSFIIESTDPKKYKILVESLYPQVQELCLALSCNLVKNVPIKCTATETLEENEGIYCNNFNCSSYGKELDINKILLKSLERLSALEDILLSDFSKCKFLWFFQLLPKNNVEVLLKTALFLKKKFLQIQVFKSLINLISAISKANTAMKTSDMFVTIMNRNKFLTEFSLQPKSTANCINLFLQECKMSLKNVIEYTTVKARNCFSDVKQHLLFFENYKYVHGNKLHLPVIQSSKYLLFLNKFSYMNDSVTVSNPFTYYPQHIWSHQEESKVAKALQHLGAHDAACLVNFYIGLMDNILNNFCNEKIHLKIPCLKYQYSQTTNENSMVEHVSKEILPFNETRGSCSNCASLSKSNETLEQAIKKEKEKQHLLNSTIEEIEQDLSDTFLQKEKLENKLLEIGKMLNYFKGISLLNFSFSEMELEYNYLSKFCLCETCVTQEIDEVIEDSIHEVLCFRNCVEWFKPLLDKAFNTKEDQKTKIELQETCSTNLGSLNSQLGVTKVQDLENLKIDLENLKADLIQTQKEYEITLALVKDKETIISELEAEKKEFNVFFEQCKDKLLACEEQVCRLSVDRDMYKQEVKCKEENIQLLQKVIDNQNFSIQDIRSLCDQYEVEIKDLNQCILEIKKKDINSEKIVEEFNDKIILLEKDKELLNVTIETKVKDLLSVNSQMLILEEEVGKLTERITNLDNEISSLSEKYNLEKEVTSELSYKLQELEFNKNEMEQQLNQAKHLISQLQNDISILKNVQRAHEDALLAKNQSLKESNLIIQQLQKRIQEIDEKSSSKETKHQNELNRLNIRLEELNKCNSELERKLEMFKSIEKENISILEKLKEQHMQKEQLEKSLYTLKLDLENISKKFAEQKCESDKIKIEFQNTCAALSMETDLRVSIEKEINLKDEKIASLCLSLKEHIEKTSDLENSILKLKEENKTLKKNKISESIDKLIALEKEINQTKSDFQLKKAECSKLSKEIQKLQADNNAYQKKIIKIEPALSKAVGCAESILDLMSGIISSCPNYSEGLISALNDEKMQLLQFIEGYEAKVFSPELINSLKEFLESQFHSSDEDLKICSLVSSVADTVNNVRQFIENITTNGEIIQFSGPGACLADNTINITLLESNIIGNLKEKTIYSHNQTITELQQIQELLQVYFGHLENFVLKQMEECKDLKLKLDQVSQKSSEASKEADEKNPLKWKYKLVKMNCQRWENQANKLKQSCAEYKEKIKTLEEKLALETELKEKIKVLEEEKIQLEKEMKLHIETLEEKNKSLDDEAEELANDFRNLQKQHAEECTTLYEQIENLTENIEKCKKENKLLKYNLHKCQRKVVGNVDNPITIKETKISINK